MSTNQKYYAQQNVYSYKFYVNSEVCKCFSSFNNNNKNNNKSNMLVYLLLSLDWDADFPDACNSKNVCKS